VAEEPSISVRLRTSRQQQAEQASMAMTEVRGAITQ
jgi:hypothetical protein